MSGTFEAASSRACACAPWRGGSNTTQSKGLSSAATNGRRNRSRACASIGLRPCVVSAARLQRGDGVLVAVRGSDARALGEPQRKRADAGEQIGDLRPPRRNAPRPDPPAPLRRRPSPAGRRPAAAARARGPSITVGVARCDDELAVARQPREPVTLGKPRKLAGSRRGQRPRAAHVDVEPGSRSRSPGCRAACASAPSASAIAQAASIAPSRPGARIGQRSIATM